MNHPNYPVAPSEDQGASTETAAPETAGMDSAIESSFGDILSQFEQEHHDHKTGETVQGVVVALTKEAAVIDIGRKTEGILPLDVYLERTGQAEPKVGEPITVTIAGRDEEGYYQLSTLKVERPRDWSAMEAAFAGKQTIAGRVVEAVKGGLRVDIGARAFMPASRSGARDQVELEKLVGQEIQCRITKLDTAKEDIVVDRRVILEEETAKTKQAAFAALQEGAVMRGTVRSLTDFGAFVDLGGFDGLLHVTDIAWTRIAKPADVLKVGEQVDVKILKINPETRRISLGRKHLIPDPWSLASEKYQVGQRVTGKVTRTTDFGAFVELEPGIEGMIHLSEMSWTKRVRKPSDVVKPDESVDVVVLGVNATDHRIALGLKQALGDPWEAAQQKYPVGSVIEGAITSLTKFGAFVDLGEGIEGMIHIADITREKRLDHPQEVLKSGQVVKAQVLELDKERRRIRLGMKQLEPTSADEYIKEHQVGETVTGRVVDVSGTRVKVELGEGVFAICRIKEESGKAASKAAASSSVDLSSMTAMLAAKWKSGGGQGAVSGGGKEPMREGQVRTFKITAMDPSQKRVEIEIVG